MWVGGTVFVKSSLGIFYASDALVSAEVGCAVTRNHSENCQPEKKQNFYIDIMKYIDVLRDTARAPKPTS